MKQKDGKDQEKRSEAKSDLPLQAFLMSRDRNGSSNENHAWNELHCQGLPHIKTIYDFRSIHIN